MKHKLSIVIYSLSAILVGAGIIVYLFLARHAGAPKTATLLLGGHQFAVEIADTMLLRNKGLSDRPSLGEDAGMLFKFGSPGMYGFWMKGMRFPLDFVWIQDNRIIGFTENVEPEPDASMLKLYSYYPPSPADSVLEINAGLVEKYGVSVGDPTNVVFK